ncbi:MAG: hypothetical protein B7Z73_19105, partial [Planctomycetia bacterium 21-64-5]
MHPPEPDDPDQSYTFLRDERPGEMMPGGTVLGRAILSRGRLKAETNSSSRADLLRERIEQGCARLLRHRAREQSDPFALADRPGRKVE